MSLYYINNFYVSRISLDKNITSFLEQGDIMLFFHTKDHLDKYSTSEHKEFIKPRIRFMNDAWVFPWGTKPSQNYTLVWYEVSGFRERIHWDK